MPIKREEQFNRTAEVVHQIKEFLVSGALKPGDQLLPERELAKTLSVSRSSLREALRELSGMGLIENTPRGTYVRKATISDMMEPLKLVMSQDIKDVFMMLEARKILESGAVKLAAQRADDISLAELHDLTVRFTKEIETGTLSEETDSLFHSSIVSASKNKMLIHLMSVVDNFMKEYYASIREQMMSQVAEAFCNQHQKIYKAIRARDPELAESAAAEHIDFTIQQYLKLNEQQSLT